MSERLDVYCTKCNKNFTSETVWEAVEHGDDVLCAKCFEKVDTGVVSYVEFYE